jgi:cytoskeletal protein CcmA (bactofilin family)
MANAHGSTVIGESILINGTVTGEEDLTVRGKVEGTITLAKTLMVEDTGVVKAEINVKNCIIAGVVVGNVTATESVEVAKGGRVVGDIAAPRVIIVDGAAFRGRVDMGNVELPNGDRPRNGKSTRSVERPVRQERKEASNGHRTPGRPPAPPHPVAIAGVKRKVIVKRK